MPTIPVTDQLGLLVDAQINPDSSLARYLKSIAALKFTAPDVGALTDLSLANLPIQSLQFGIDSQPVAGDVPVSAGATGNLAVRTISGEDDLFQSDQTYLSLGLEISASADAFGIQPGVQATLTNSRPFAPETKLPEALGQTLSNFSIPLDFTDLTAMTPGTVVDIDGIGSLTFTGTANLLAVTNPLATVSLPAPVGPLNVSAGGSIQVGATFTLTGEYEIGVGKRSANVVRLAYRKKLAAEFDIQAKAEASLSAGIGGNDLTARVLSAISADPQADSEALGAAGVKPEQIAQIQGAIQAAVDRRLALAACFAFGSLRSRESAFLYEVDLGALDDAGRKSLERALHGDLSGWREDTLPAGVQLVRSVFTTLRQRTHTFKVNLLGIYGFGSISRLALEGSVRYEPQSGDLVITDTATASRIESTTLNFGADTEKLRQVLAESFLITAAYQSSAATAGPDLVIQHAYFELHARTNRQNMRDQFDVAHALGLVVDAAAFMQQIDDFGRTTFYVETRYNSALATSLFLDQEQPRAAAEYEQIGRSALQLLVAEDDPDAYRRKPAIDDALWNRMKATGQPGIPALFPDLNPVAKAVIQADYTVIVWWADAMRTTAEVLAEMRAFLSANPGVDLNGDDFQKLRKKLAGQLRKVAANTKKEFGQPWGLVAMDFASGRRAAAELRILGPRLTVALSRSVAGAVTGPSV
jgi:hypothetical protein